MKSNMKKEYKIIWIESICDLPEIIEYNIKKTKINSPDYKNWKNPEQAAEDFRKRIQEYEKIYDPLSIKSDGFCSSFIKLINQGDKMIIRNVRGYVESKIISYLTNLHTGNRPIYFLCHGESEFNEKGLIGGDSNLSEKGLRFCELLKTFFEKEFSLKDLNYNNDNNDINNINDAYYALDSLNNYSLSDRKNSLSFNLKEKEKPQIFCSTLKRAIQTAENLSFLNNYQSEKLLDEINPGNKDGMLINEIPLEEKKERLNNKLYYRSPMGESYMDVIQRIEPIIFEMERIRSPIIVIGHLGMLKCLYGYFANLPIKKIPNIKIPMHYVIKFVPEAYGFYETRYDFDVENKKIFKDDRDFINDLENGGS